MLNKCEDNYIATFDRFADMLSYHKVQSKTDQWSRSRVCDIEVEPLDPSSPILANPSAFAPGTSTIAIEDTLKNSGFAVKLNGNLYLLRESCMKSLIERAKISGTVIPKLSRQSFAKVINECLKVFKSESISLIRDEKISAIHSGDKIDYSVLPVAELLETVQMYIDKRFPGNKFIHGYANHSLVRAMWEMPSQKDDLLASYKKFLDSQGKGILASKLMPGVTFMTSDTGISSAKVSAILLGSQHPINLGNCIAVEHRHMKTVKDFEIELDQLFAQFCDSVAKLQKLAEIELEYPVSAMIRVCKKLKMPKKAAMEAVSMFEMAYGESAATAHDVFLAMQEIPFILRTESPEHKMIAIEENLARALSIKWAEYDIPKAVY